MIVYIVGAGSGDVGLLTLKAKECIEEADVILYDSLVNPSILSFAKPCTECICVGKRKNNHTFTQDEIHSLLLEKSRTDSIIVRLKGGDPYLFGRGAEEALFLASHNIPFAIVPGVTTASALSYAGIALTTRGYAQSVTFLTAHTKHEHNWKALLAVGGTLVFYMSGTVLHHIASSLLDAGMDTNTLTSVVYNVSLPEQRVYRQTLEQLQTFIADDTNSPAILIIGNILDMQENLSWYEDLPLFGVHCVVTRDSEHNAILAKKLLALGAKVSSIPSIEIVPLPREAYHTQTLEHLEDFSHILFTSKNAVRIFWQHLHEHGYDSRKLSANTIITIGNSTREVLQQYGIDSDFTPETVSSPSLAQYLAHAKHLLFPCAKAPHNRIITLLEEYNTEFFPLYSTEKPVFDTKLSGTVDYIIVASPSSVDNFLSHFPEYIHTPNNTHTFISIGNSTTAVLEIHAVQCPIYTAMYPTLDSIIETIIFAQNRKLQKK